MPTNLNWPLLVDSVAFAGDPNDSGATPTWTDLSNRVTEFSAGRGRQYELDTNEAGEASLKIEDTDEALNPANTGSVYYPNVVPYRQYTRQAMWPPLPVGSAVNLLNLSAATAMDPSFESYTTGAAVSWITAVGAVTPTITTTNPQQGSKSLTWTVAGGATLQGVAITVACIPGQQYTASGYVRQSSASTQIIAVDGSSGTITTTTGSYVRLSKTFTATQQTHTIQWRTSGTAVAGTVNVDAIQLEVGASASTFATTGPVIHGVHRGLIERWPAGWRQAGTKGYTEPTAVDAFAILAGHKLDTEVRNSILVKSPNFYWPLGEPSGAVSFGEVTSNGRSLTRYNTSVGPAPTFEPGTSTTMAGDAGGTGVLINATQAFDPLMSVIQTGRWDLNTLDVGGAIPGVSNTTTAIWVSRSATIANQLSPFLTLDGAYGIADLYAVDYNPGAKLGCFGTEITDLWADGQPHLYVQTAAIVTGSGTFTTYVDGVSVDSFSVSTDLTRTTSSRLEVGGHAFGFVGPPNGVYSHVGIWNRVLSGTEITDLHTAGLGYTGELSGARISRYLSYGWSGATAVDSGSSAMAAGPIAAGTSLLDACLEVTASENGNFFVSKSGAVTFKGRADRYLKTTSTWTFGEQEYPYEDGVTYDFDPTRVANNVTITRTGGVVAVGGTATDRAASQKKYFSPSFERTISVASDLETIDCSNWLFAQLKQPVQRISAVTLSPGTNPNLWPLALGAEIGDRVTVKRRTGVFTMSADFFIEKIEHANTPGVWTTTFQLSPVANTNVWILGDSTYGVLDTTTILGY